MLDDGFEFEGRRYRSLPAIAEEVTGTNWGRAAWLAGWALAARGGLTWVGLGTGAPIYRGLHHYATLRRMRTARALNAANAAYPDGSGTA